MAILDLNNKNVVDESRPENIKTREYLTQDQLQTSTLFSKDHALDHISQYIAGMKWTVTYFLQLRNMNDELTQLDINIPATIQKYHRINKLEIYLQSGIDQDNITNIEFECVINAGFLVNKHDIILAELTGGREALFILKEVDLKKYGLHDIYWCTFKLLTFVDSNNSDLYNNLMYKVVKEYVYDKNHLLDYSAPIILQSDYKRKLNLKDTFREITDYYFNNFLDQDTYVITPPTNRSKYTDLYLTEFLLSIIDVTDHPDLTKMIFLDKTMLKKSTITIWDVISKRDITLLKRANRDIGFVYNPYTNSDYIIRNYNMLGINFIANVITTDMVQANPDYINISTYDKYITQDNEDTYEVPLLSTNDKYVVSDNLYDLIDNQMGILERNLKKYLVGDLCDSSDIDKMVEQYHMWSTKEQYYLIPILLVLIKDSIMHTYKQI